jgi:sugar transferase (PEP-CTERM system associated)
MSKILMQRVTWRSVTLIAGETALIVGVVAFTAYLRLGEHASELFREQHGLAKSFLIAGVCQLCLYYADLYDFRGLADRRELFIRIVQALGATSLILAAIYVWFPAASLGNNVFFLAALCVITLVVGWRVLFEWLTRHVAPRERLLLVGTSAAAVDLARELYDRPGLGVEIVGFVDPDPTRVGMPVLNPGVIGTIDEIPKIVRTRSVDRVVVSLIDARGMLPMDKLLEMKLDGVTFDHLASVYEEYTGKIAVENLRPSWLIFSSGFRKNRVVTAAKRVFDVLLATAGLVVLFPVMALVGLAIKLTSKGPIFYHQQRVGQHGRVFTVHKFRSMRPNAEERTGAVWARKADDRLTPIGGFLRRTRLDELPQLWNVLCGEMSVVGPRPERPEFVSYLTHEIPFYGQRHVVKPGLTGWAQVRYTYGASVEDAMEKLQYDLFYIKNLSLALDLFIVLKTIKIVILRRGAH